MRVNKQPAAIDGASYRLQCAPFERRNVRRDMKKSFGTAVSGEGGFMYVPVVPLAQGRFALGLAVFAAVASLIGLGAGPAWPEPADSSLKQGQALAFDRGKGNCLACHQIAGGDLTGNIGPTLDHMKNRFPDRKDLHDLIWDESKRNPQTVMPPFGTNHILTEDEINKVIDFLYGL